MEATLRQRISQQINEQEVEEIHDSNSIQIEKTLPELCSCRIDGGLQNRGVQDILIACIDNLKGFAEAISSVYPETTVRLCIVHQIHNSCKYVGSKHQKEFVKDLKFVYQAVSKEPERRVFNENVAWHSLF